MWLIVPVCPLLLVHCNTHVNVSPGLGSVVCVGELPVQLNASALPVKESREPKVLPANVFVAPARNAQFVGIVVYV